MGATATGKHDRSDVLNAIAWAVLLSLMVVVSVVRSARLSDRDSSYEAGWAFGDIVVSLLVAFVIGLIVQKAILKRRGFPWWIGAIALLFNLLMGAVTMQRVNEKTAAASCLLGARPYGAPPSGLRYEKASATQRADIARKLKLSARDVDVTYAVRGRERTVMLIAMAGAGDIPLANRDEINGRRVEHKTFDGTPVAITDSPTGAHTVMTTRGCVGYTVASIQAGAAEGIVREILR